MAPRIIKVTEAFSKHDPRMVLGEAIIYSQLLSTLRIFTGLKVIQDRLTTPYITWISKLHQILSSMSSVSLFVFLDSLS